MLNNLIKAMSKGEVSDAGREMIHRFIKEIAKGEASGV